MKIKNKNNYKSIHWENFIQDKFINIDESKLIDFRNYYLNNIKRLSKGNYMVTDKAPLNFFYIGLILCSLPEAKIVNVNRIIPITIDEATTCCHLKGLEVLFAKAHIENAGEDCMPIKANMYVIHIIPVQTPPTAFEPDETI